jgi:hypothetical protein
MLEKLFKLKSNSTVKQYGKLYFEHLSADFRVAEAKISDENDKKILNGILEKNKNNLITWDDIQVFDLILLKYQDYATIKGKLFTLRERYISLLNAAELERYKGLKKVDLDNATEADIVTLREEYSLLIRDFCLRYMFISGRERLRSKLLRSGAVMMLFFFLLVAIIGTVASYLQETPLVIDLNNDNSAQLARFNTSKILYGYATIAIVVFAGVTGAFVSMQQRIQSFVYSGDPVMDLSMMTHGWLSIFLSPLSGAIFAVILYLFFAGNLLSGVIFPEFFVSPTLGNLTINAKSEPYFEDTSEQNNTAQSNTSNQANTNTQLNGNTNQAENSGNTTGNVNTATKIGNQPDSNSTSKEIAQDIPMQLNYFVTTTGPKAGKDFALLLIWCFIAGFAERFVPDALMRLVDQKKKGETA